MKKALGTVTVVLAVAVDVVALFGGIIVAVATRNEWYFAISILAALAVFGAAWFYHRWIVKIDREAKARTQRRRAVGVVRLHAVRLMAATPNWRRTLPPLPNLSCSARVPRRAA